MRARTGYSASTAVGEPRAAALTAAYAPARRIRSDTRATISVQVDLEDGEPVVRVEPCEMLVAA